jgi:hypothetical protein
VQEAEEGAGCGRAVAEAVAHVIVQKSCAQTSCRPQGHCSACCLPAAQGNCRLAALPEEEVCGGLEPGAGGAEQQRQAADTCREKGRAVAIKLLRKRIVRLCLLPVHRS